MKQVRQRMLVFLFHAELQLRFETAVRRQVA
jgi:hypothetical protein